MPTGLQLEGRLQRAFDDDTLLFRRQYLVCSHPDPPIDGWRTTQLDTGFYIHSHPELAVSSTQHGEIHAALIGFAFDCRDPNLTQAEVLRRMADSGSQLDKALQTTTYLAGSYLFLLSRAGQTILIGDCASSRQCFATWQGEQFYAASTPNLISRVTHLNESPEDDAFLESDWVRNNPNEFWWPGTASSYADVHCLLPNNYIDVSQKRFVRYWPTQTAFPSLPYDEVVQEVASVLRNVVGAASQQLSPLCLAASGGLDSRLLMAAAHEHRERIFYYTNCYPSTPKSDINIPHAMLQAMGCKLNKLNAAAIPGVDALRRQLCTIAAKTVPAPREHKLYGVANNFALLPENSTVITGNANETIRSYYGDSSSNVSADDLARMAGMHDNPLALSEFALWLEELPTKLPIPVEDLFYWEMRQARWGGQNCNEVLLSHEVYLPFATRRYFELAFAVPVEQRAGKKGQFFLDVLNCLEPAYAKWPINPPPSLAVRARRKLARILRRILKK